MSLLSVTLLTIAVQIAWAVQGRAGDQPARGRYRPARSPAWWLTCTAIRLSGLRSGALPTRRSTGRPCSGADGRFRLAALMSDKPITVWAECQGLARAARRRPHLPRQGPRHRPAHALTRHPYRWAVSSMRRASPDRRNAESSSSFTATCSVTRSLRSRPSGRYTPASEGRFATPPLPAGDAHFTVIAPGKVRTFVGKNAEPGTSSVDLGDVMLRGRDAGRGRSSPTARASRHPESRSSPTTTGRTRRRPTRRAGSPSTASARSQEPAAPVERLLQPQAFRRHPRPGRPEVDGDQGLRDPRDGVDAETGKPVPIDTVRLCMVERDPKDGHVTLVG